MPAIQKFILSVHNAVQQHIAEKIMLVDNIDNYVALFFTPLSIKAAEYVSLTSRSPPVLI